MYSDAVLNKDYQPIFNGTSAEVKEWIQARIDDDEEVQNSMVYLGRTLTITSVQNYITNT